MKKYAVLFLATILFSVSKAIAAPGDIEAWNFKATTNPAVQISSDGRFRMTDGIMCQKVIYTNPTVSTNGVLNVEVATSVLRAQGTTYAMGPFITQPINPQALTLRHWTNLESSTSTTQSTATVYGLTAMGRSVSEQVIVTTNTARTKQAFLSITSITYQAFDSWPGTSTTPNMYLVVGATDSIGLPFGIVQTSDVYKVVAFGVDSSSWTTTAGNANTLNFTAGMRGITTTIEVWGRETKSPYPRPK